MKNESVKTFLTILLLVIAPAVYSQSSDQVLTPPRKDLVAVRWPDLTGLEASVREQIMELQKSLANTAKVPGVSASMLSEAYGKLGQIYHAYYLIEPARNCYLNASLLAPKDFRWTYFVAKLDQQEGRFEEAIRRYRIARSLRPDYVAVPVHLGNIFLELNRIEEARSSFSAALEIDKNNPSAHYGLGQIALSTRNYAEAIQHFEATLAQAPSANRVHYSLAMAYRGLGDLEKVKGHLAQQGTVGVRVSDPLVDDLQQLVEGERLPLARGKVAFEAKRYEEAAAEFRKAVASKPDSVTARINLGAALTELGDSSGAIEQFEEALRIDPRRVNAHFNLAFLLARQNQHDKAIAHLQSAIPLEPNDSSVRFLLGQELVLVGRLDDALVQFTRVVQLDPNNESAMFEQVKLTHRKGQFKQALDILEKAHARYPQKGRTVLMLVYLLTTSPALELRNGARALPLAQSVYNATGSPRHRVLVLLALAELGRCHEASDLRQRMMLEEQNHPELLAKLRSIFTLFELPTSCRPTPDASLGDLTFFESIK